jgi:hypothetical protein
MPRLPLALAMLITTAPAIAQTTNCVANGNFIRCKTRNGSESGGSLVDFVRSAQTRHMRAKVLNALKAGDCSTAMSMALDGNDMELASGVQSFCTRQGATASAAP